MSREKAELRLLKLVAKQNDLAELLKSSVANSYSEFNKKLVDATEEKDNTKFASMVFNLSEDTVIVQAKMLVKILEQIPNIVLNILEEELPAEIKLAQDERLNKMQEAFVKSLGLDSLLSQDVQDLPEPPDGEVN